MFNRFLSPLRTIRVKMYMKNGTVLTGYVDSIVKKLEGNDLRGLRWEGDMPFYFKLSEIIAIETQKIWRWKS